MWRVIAAHGRTSFAFVNDINIGLALRGSTEARAEVVAQATDPLRRLGGLTVLVVVVSRSGDHQ